MLEFWRFRSVDAAAYIEMSGQYNSLLVLLSIGVAALSAYSALIVLERIWGSSQEKMVGLWLLCGSGVMGSGVWAMHFTGMLAFRMALPMSYDPWITFLSALPAIVGAYVALKILSKKLFGFWWIQLGSICFAAGVGAMHFVGMESMVMPALMVYSLPLFIGSIIVAHVLATIALYVRVLVKTDESSRPYWRMLSAAVMGAAVSGMHYTAMEASTYYVIKGLEISREMASRDHIVLSVALFLIVAVFVGITLIGTLIDRRLQSAEDSETAHRSRVDAVLETLSDGFIVIDEAGKIEVFNRSGALMFKRQPDEVLGEEVSLLMPGIDHQRLVQDARLVNKEIIGTTVELEGLTSSGELFPIEVTFSEMNLGTGIMFNAVIRDITVSKMLAEQLKQSQKMESIGHLAAGIAHEINTPIQFVSDNNSFLKKVFGNIITALHESQNLLNAHDQEEQRQRTEEALKNAKIAFISDEVPKAIDQSLEGLQRVATIVSAMKSFSHPSNGEKEPTDIQEAIEATATVANNEWKYIAKMHFEFDPALPTVPCQRDEFNQVVLNLIVNAAHAIADDRGENSGELGNIHICTSHDTQYVTVTITDDGLGISKEIQQKIFDPFFTTKEVGKGTGQGLSLAYSVIVDKHGGVLKVESEEGKGTTFIIRLPLLDSDEESALQSA